MKASDQLKEEHEGITLMLEVLAAVCTKLDKAETVPDEDLRNIVEFFQVFADRCHHSKEEEFLFPAYQSAGVSRDGGPLGVMLEEHQQGRALLGEMNRNLPLLQNRDPEVQKRFLESGRNYIHLLSEHISKENHCLFPMGDQGLSEARQQELLKEFDRLENTRIGAGKHEAYHRLMEELEEKYL